MAHRYCSDVLPANFTLRRHGSLLLCKAIVTGPRGAHDATLLLDTGSNYTVVTYEILEKVGCSAAMSRAHIRITTANGVVVAPRVRTQALTIFDHKMEGANVVAHDLPFSGPIDGLLGMDVLVALRARIDIGAATIEIE